jgi:hypothetical protein
MWGRGASVVAVQRAGETARKGDPSSMGKKSKGDTGKGVSPGLAPNRARRVLLGAAGVVLLAGIVTGALFWPAGSGRTSGAFALAPESALPANVRKAPPDVREAYRFAIANRDILRKIPCYCGCGAEHQSNAECYIKDVRPDGRIQFDYMSLG